MSIDAQSTVQMQIDALGDPMPALFDVPPLTFARVSVLKIWLHSKVHLSFMNSF